MSGIYIGTNSQLAAKAAERLSFAPGTARWNGRLGSASYAVTRVDSAGLWSPAIDLETGVQILLGGRVSFDEIDWKRAETLPYEGGLANRVLIDLWLQSEARFIQAVNGAFGIVIWDPRLGFLHVFTDRLGVFPIFQSDDTAPTLCSHPDVLADSVRATGQSCDFDPVTLAEFLAIGSSVQPFTYYRQIQQLEPATHYVWSLNTRPVFEGRTVYWQPAYIEEKPSEDTGRMIESLASAITNAVRRRTLPRLGKPVVLLSGGADSRCALFGASEPANVACLTLFDEPNEELATARKLAAVVGAKHHAVQREPDYYAANAEESVRVAGGTWSLIDAHYTGVAHYLRTLLPGTILTGCYADYMFKGLLLNRHYRTLFGRNLPLFDNGAFDLGFYQPIFPLKATWQSRVDDRLAVRFPPRLREEYPAHPLRVEDLRLRPLSREPDSSGRLFLLRTMPWDHLLSDKDILDVYGRMSPGMKINGIVFGKAVGKVIGSAGRRIPNNNYGTPVDASEFQRAFWFMLAVLKRKIRRASGKESTTPRLATTGSWPNWDYYVSHSPTVARLWVEPAKSERELFTDILGRDPWTVSLAEWGKTNAIVFMRLLSAKIWLRQRGVTS